MEAIRNAAAMRPSLDLRNEAIASMTLGDLRQVRSLQSQDTKRFVLLGQSNAVADRRI